MSEVDLVPLGPDEVRCGACLQGFVPRDGTLNVVRTSWDEPGTVICPTCLANLGSRGLLTKDPDDEKFKCRCGSQDPTHKICPVHSSVTHPNTRIM